MKTGDLIYCRRAFTLLEIIVALIVASVIVAMMVPFLSSTVARSVDSVISARQHAYLNEVMDNITADFKKRSATESNPLENLRTAIGTTEGSSMSNSYGTYQVITNHYITFASGSSVTETADNNGRILKVKISYQSYTLTALFSR
jgi:prepilin-type N-terminal cleavage/methylation domain-containing protein